MLEHPLRFFGRQDESQSRKSDELSKKEGTNSRDQVSATPTPDNTPSTGDAPTLDSADGDVICGDDGVKTDTNGSPNQEDLTPSTPEEKERDK